MKLYRFVIDSRRLERTFCFAFKSLEYLESEGIFSNVWNRLATLYTPPHSLSSLTRLLALVTQFPYLLLTVFLLYSSLYATPTSYHQRFLNVR